jgi:hypothetical protein
MATGGPIAPPKTQEELLRLFSYDPDNGDFRWRVTLSGRGPAGAKAGTITWSGRRRVCIRGQRYYITQIIWCMMTGYWPAYPDEEVDHKETYGPRRDVGDRWDNLRLNKMNKNRQNRAISRKNTSGHPGVTINKGAWVAFIGHDKRRTHLGRFANFDQAVAVRQAAEIKYFGEFRPKHSL